MDAGVESSTNYYPLFLKLDGLRCLVVGAGGVGLRKAEGLLACQPQEVLVLDVAPLSEAWASLMACGRVRFAQRDFHPDDVRGRALVFAATGDRAVNERVRAACAEAGVPCNVVDDPAGSRFIVPACARQGRITAAVSTEGASPALARVLRRQLDQRLCQPYAALAEVLARLRPLVLAEAAGLPSQEDRAALFRAVAESSLAEALAQGDRAACEAVLRQKLSPPLQAFIAELLYELV